MNSITKTKSSSIKEYISHIELMDDIKIPKGYYKINKVFKDGTYWTLCYIDKNEPTLDIVEIANLIAKAYNVRLIDSRDSKNK